MLKKIKIKESVYGESDEVVAKNRIKRGIV